MAAPVWVTGNNLGIVKHLESCSKTLNASGATSYSLVSGQLPPGLTLSSDGIISGIPKVDNISANRQGTTFTFGVQALGGGSFANQNFTISVISNNLYVGQTLSLSQARLGTNFLQYQIQRGNVNISTNMIWRLEEGLLPPGATLYPNGNFEILPGHSILPFQREQFIRSDIDPNSAATLSQDYWNNWLQIFLKLPQNRDYQFRISLSETSGPVQLSLTCRIVIIKPPVNSLWFQANSNFITFNPLQEYIYFAISDNDFINWETANDLGSVFNGAVSELSVNATCASNKKIIYAIKPSTNSQLPQQLTLTNGGLIAGRVSFRCHQDDPISVPVNDDYTFTIRASTVDKFTYTERTFNLHVIRFHDKPYNNLYARSFPSLDQRIGFNKVINDPIIFPDEFIYRAEDKYFGKARNLRFLVAPGIPPAITQDYFVSLAKSYYNKTLLFDSPKTAVAYDQNRKIKYEVVYLPILRDMQRIIDSRDFGNSGVIPSWMNTPQPIPNTSNQFYAAEGFIVCIVLAYTTPGTSAAIAYRIKNAGINFNQFRFEFDRYELDDNMSLKFNSSTNTFLPSIPETTFDNGTTIFENGSTRFKQNLDFSTEIRDRDPDYGTKYLKFPDIGASF